MSDILEWIVTYIAPVFLIFLFLIAGVCVVGIPWALYEESKTDMKCKKQYEAFMADNKNQFSYECFQYFNRTGNSNNTIILPMFIK